ncbi:hypothetical protein DACRYDRAFT_115785 [Dacryopinax primogenitus]|uniref:RRM domain-containing protein n=1 Tax=Dacryopinax primogenitus (strain DJM 731) TaxID=1858805 RepID=M5FXR1_DACPD|nr:uncharacterized protein DACRYDRAFT_115785 [Dacryopinax primogenitus]EJU02821.1 hypothetical protein DACRYDRAFT_115785 [Dacryopinax primogenitus]
MLRGPYSGYDEHAVPMRRPSPPPRYGGPDNRGGYGGNERGYNDHGGNDRRGRGGRGRNRGRGGRGGGGGPPQSAYPQYDDAAMDPYYPPAPPQDDYYRDEYGTGDYDDPSRRRAPPPPRREREVNENLIEERIQRERPCRTLFIRNIKYESNGEAIRARFEEFGEIRTFFDLISNRGMVFVTFYDLRAAERARDRLQGTDIAGRPIDVHYSLPRENETNSRCDREKNQGSVQVTLRDSSNRQPINQGEVRRIFTQHGDVKSVRAVGSARDAVVVELYDMRATEQIIDTMNHAPLQDGYMELDWAWDIPDTPLPAPPTPTQPLPRRPEPSREREPRGYEDDYRDSAPRGGGGGRGRGRGRGRGGGGYDDRDDRRSRRDSRGHDDFEPRRNSGRQEDRYPEDPYRAPRAAGAIGQPESDRLEAAKKVQELLQALKPPTTAQTQSPTRAAQPPPPPQQPAYYGAPPLNPYMPPQPQSAVPSYPVPAAPGPQLIPNAATIAASLPPSVLALLHQANAFGQPGQPVYQPPAAAAPNPYGAPSYSQPPASANLPTTNPTAMQQILEMIAAQSKRV